MAATVGAPGAAALLSGAAVPVPDNCRCLVLGAGGFIGINLCLTLAEAGAAVTGMGRAAAPPAALRGRVRWVRADAERLADPDSAVADHTHLFDLVGAGLPNSSNDDPAQAVADGLPGRIRLLESCRRRGTARILYASSGGT
ncbi:MAG: NAD-dependent epimerase/dehydratase family protein, partial [Gluconacetobacter diazotrophicus]|nr:NAD-dependent epimerase/dehydratase family protein [Gluconacetobacter diazotrophicus]